MLNPLDGMTILQKIGFNFACLLFATPIWAFIILKVYNFARKAWKENNEVKKWIAICLIFFFAMVLSGVLDNNLTN